MVSEEVLTREELFQRAMESAQANGLKLGFSYRRVYEQILNKEIPFWIARSFIVWPPFAEAFWGKTKWKQHLKKMAVSEDPFDYLAGFLGN
jgi:hypothetical protein